WRSPDRTAACRLLCSAARVRCGLVRCRRSQPSNLMLPIWWANSSRIGPRLATGRYPLLDTPEELFPVPFATMPQQIGVERILGMGDIGEVQVDAVQLLRVTRITIAYCTIGHHRADVPPKALLGFHSSRLADDLNRRRGGQALPGCSPGRA